MKQILKLFLIFISALLLNFSLVNSIHAYTAEEEICYAECANYKFVWQGNYCWDLFQQNCSMGTGASVKKAISLIKDVYSAASKGSISSFSIDTVFKAWFVCKPLIEQCIVPQLQSCRSTCSVDSKFYAPDLSVGHPYGNFVYHGVVYNDDYHTLTFKVVNNGRGYAWDIGAEASWGHTRNRNGMVSGGGQLFKETIPEMIYFGARNGPPKTVGDYVVDFLIEESNFSKYLQDFKSEADDYNVPVIWLKTIPFTAPEGELTKVIFNVDPNQMIAEYSELNNTFVLTIDKLPTPPSFEIDDFNQNLETNTLNNFLIDFDIKNNGQENGQAIVKIFEDKYNDTNTQTPIYENHHVVEGLNKFGFSTYITPDITKNEDYCGKTKKYELVVFDDNGKVDSHEFSLPLYSGSVRGRVEDLFDKNVEGATITATSGQTTTTSKSGSYYLHGIDMLGNVTITASHPEFSKVETKVLDFKINNINDPCAENGLAFNQVNFVLKDQDVLFTITIKDSQGYLVPAHVLASNQDWRFEQDITDELTPIPGMQPGKYVFTISAPGYKTISQDVNAVPNNQNLEFTLEKLNGRLSDEGLTILQEPQLLWQMNRGTEIFANMAATKDGKLVMLYTSQNKANTGKLYFLDSLTGNQIKVISGTIATGGNSQACLDTSYDGNTTALYVHERTAGIARDTRNVLQLFNNQGDKFGTIDLKSGGSAHECDVSPDGFYIYPDKLMNKGLYIYTRFDIEGIENSEQAETYAGTVHFMTDNNLTANCPEGGGLCKQSIYENVITNYGQYNSSYRKADSSQNSANLAILTTDKVYFFNGANKAWEKDVITRGDPLSLSVSPGGKYVVYSTAHETRHPRIFKIFTDNNIDKTMGEFEDSDEDVIFVHANDKGIFVATEHGKIIKYYQVGKYETEYNPQVQTTPTPENETSGLSYFENGGFHEVGIRSFNELVEGLIYAANRNINLDMGNGNGALHILNGTIFSVDGQRNPVLLKGQMTADFNSPATIIAIKFDRFNMNLFQEKLNKFVAGNLPQSEFFIVKNIHTKFKVSNYENSFNVAVSDGQVAVLGYDIDEKIESGKQIIIDGENNIKETIYLDWKIYVIIIGAVLLISSVLLFVYRKTKVGKKIISVLKIIAVFTWKYLKIICKWLWINLKKLLAWLWKTIKIVIPKIGKFIKKLISKKK